MNETDIQDFVRTVHCCDDNNPTMNCAMISCNVGITDYGKIVRSRKFPCYSYSESIAGGISGIVAKRDGNGMFHFNVEKPYIMIYPMNNNVYTPQDLIDYFHYIKKTIDKNAEMMSYVEYVEKHNTLRL